MVWVVLVLGLNGYLIYNIYQSILRFSQRPIHTIVGAEYATSLVFPAVTICNYNQFRRSAIEDHEHLQFLKQLLAVESGMMAIQTFCVSVAIAVCVPVLVIVAAAIVFCCDLF